MTVLTSLKLQKPDRAEILRYAGFPKKAEADDELEALLSSVMREAEGVFDNRVCFERLGIKRLDGSLILGGIKIDSSDLLKSLKGCDEAVIFAATVGTGIDRLINRYSRVSPSRASLFQAYGAERIEALCDALCAQIEADMKVKLRPRFSAGYGDLDLSLQKDIFSLLECEKRIGLTLNGSLLMSPTKSVTAIVGLYN